MSKVLNDRDAIIYLAHERMAEWGGKIVDSSVRTSRIYQEKGEKLLYYLQAIQYEFYLEESEIVALLTCINKLAELTDWPTAPVITCQDRPDILLSGVGTSGADGDDGADGSDANINTVSGDNSIVVVTAILNGIKTNTITYFPYTFPTVVVSLDSTSFPNPNSLIQELGQSIGSVPFTSTLNKGKDIVDSATVLAPSALDGAFQAAFNLSNLNAGNEEVVTIFDTNITANKTYTTEIDDLTNQPTNSKSIQFVVPFLYGDSTSVLVQGTFYSNLTRIIESQGNKIVTFDAEDSYFYFMYPATYPDLDKILDSNGFNAIDAFTKSDDVDVDMLSGVVAMTVYRTIITDIPNQDYTMIF